MAKAKALLAAGVIAATTLTAQAELIYRPIQNGDPGMLSQRFQRAAAQDTTRSPSAAARRPPRTALERLEDDLRRQLVRDISRQAAGILRPGRDGSATLQFSGVEVTLSEDDDGVVSIFAVDAATGEETEIRIGDS